MQVERFNPVSAEKEEHFVIKQVGLPRTSVLVHLWHGTLVSGTVLQTPCLSSPFGFLFTARSLLAVQGKGTKLRDIPNGELGSQSFHFVELAGTEGL